MNKIINFKNVFSSASRFLGGSASISVYSMLIVFSTTQLSYAEDIEIYENLVDNPLATNTLSENKPNILFLLDTSGSMQTLTAVQEDRPPYDPAVDYGGSPDGIYVYNANSTSGLSYTGMWVSNAVNNCQAAVDFHSSNANFPQYVDKALVWEYTPEVVGNTCSGGGGAPSVDSRTRNGTGSSYPYLTWFTFDSFSATPGNTFDISITSRRKIFVRARFLDSSNNDIPAGSNWSICNDLRVPRRSTRECGAGTVPAGAASVEIQVFDDDPRFTEDTTVTFTQSSTCIPVPSVPEDGDWKALADDLTNLDLRGLECQADDGFHGANGSSGATFAQYKDQGASAAATQAKFTTSADPTQRVDWSSSTVPSRVLVPANYHDYLQLSVLQLYNLLNGGTGSITPTVIAATNGAGSTRDQIQVDANNWCTGNNNRDGSFVQVTTPTSGLDDNIFLCRSRMAILKESTANLLSTLTNMNVGIMRFNFNADTGTRNGNHGGTLVTAVQDIDGGSGANRAQLIADLRRLTADGNTPLQESLYEAYSYFAGNTPPSRNEQLQVAPVGSTVDIPTNLTLTTSAAQTDSNAINSSNGRYSSPIINSCQDNNIILFSDGQPTQDTAYEGTIESNLVGGDCTGSGNGECLDDLAGFMATTNKVNPSANGTTNQVYTHTIAFGGSIPILEDTSNAGRRPGAALDSQHYDATNAQQLTAAFQSIFQNIEQVSSDTFVAPAVSVNSFNRQETRSDVYFAVFEPNNSPRWYGNVKKYRLKVDTSTNELNFIDVNDNLAVDPSTGFFIDTARSFWSDSADGAEIREGGFAGELDIVDRPRSLYANLDPTNTTVDQLTLTNFVDQIARTDTDGDGDIVGDADDIDIGAQVNPDIVTNTSNIARWSLGLDVDDELGAGVTNPNFFVADTLHSTPYVVSFGTSASTPNDVIFATTNQGMIHAIDGSSGEELWAYLPDETLFKNLGAYYNDTDGSPHFYGLDSEIAFDVERNPTSNAIDKANLFFGQRRGGKKYFGISVKDARPTSTLPAGPGTPATPVFATGGPVKKLWTLSNLPRMGQSWATPIPATINYCTGSADSTCAPRDVLIISGGYDPKYDDYENANGTVKTLSSLSGQVEGNAIYIVDNHDGNGDGIPDNVTNGQPALLWMAGRTGQVADSSRDFSSSEMTHSFPSEPAVIDADFDGVADLMFAVDIAGRVWRFDFRGHVDTSGGGIEIDDNDIRSDNNNGTNKEVSGGIIAELSESSRNRRFYNPLDVSITPRDSGQLPRYNIVTGSGYRAHPLHDETTENNGDNNRIYAVFDRNLLFPQLTSDSNGDPDGGITYNYDESGGSLSRIEAGDLGEIDSSTTLDVTSTHENGFYVDLLKGTSEKMINRTITKNFRVLAVSYSPTPVSTTASNAVCQQDLGSSSLYQIDLRTGAFVSGDLDKSGISPNPTIVQINDGNGNVVEGILVGTQIIESVDDSVNVSDPTQQTNTLSNTPDGVIRLNWWEK